MQRIGEPRSRWARDSFPDSVGKLPATCLHWKALGASEGSWKPDSAELRMQMACNWEPCLMFRDLPGRCDPAWGDPANLTAPESLSRSLSRGLPVESEKTF